MKINNVENLMQFQVMSEVMKSMDNGSGAFQVMMQSLMKAMENNNGSLSSLGFGNSDLSKLGYGGGASLFGNEYIDDSSLGEDFSAISNIPNRESIDKAIKEASEKYGIEERLIRAIIKNESDYNPRCISSAGAMGLMQLMPENVRDYGVENPYDISENIDAGTHHISDYLELYANNKEMALAAYNAGPGTLRRRGIFSANQFYNLPSETKHYIKKVMKDYGK